MMSRSVRNRMCDCGCREDSCDDGDDGGARLEGWDLLARR